VSPILGIIASAQTAGSFGDYESIATVTVGAGGASSITFSSIPSTYTHLQIRGIGQDNGAGITRRAMVAQINSDSGNNYAQHLMSGDGSAAGSGATVSTNFAYLAYLPENGNGQYVYNSAVIDFLDYANTNKYKTIRSLNGFDANGYGSVLFASSLWMSTSAINSITITPRFASGTFSQYSSFALYGIK